MLSLPIQSQYVIAPLTVVILSLLLGLTEPASSLLLAYDRYQIEAGQVWRMFTGHFLHTNPVHLLLNLTGIVLLWALHGHYYKTKRFCVIWILLCLGTSTCLYFFSETLKWYVGLSGVLHGLFIVGAYFDIKHHFKTGWLMLLGIFAKVLHEQIYGASQNVATLINAKVAIDAHLFGTITGCGIILYFVVNNLIAKKEQSWIKN